MKNTLGWAHYQVRKGIVIRRHWQMVCLAFTFCWWKSSDFLEAESSPRVILGEDKHVPSAQTRTADGGTKEPRSTQESMPLVAAGAAKGEGLARTIRNAHALLEGVLAAPANGAKSAA